MAIKADPALSSHSADNESFFCYDFDYCYPRGLLLIPFIIHDSLVLHNSSLKPIHFLTKWSLIIKFSNHNSIHFLVSPMHVIVSQVYFSHCMVLTYICSSLRGKDQVLFPYRTDNVIIINSIDEYTW
jgi:hypothetical protein